MKESKAYGRTHFVPAQTDTGESVVIIKTKRVEISICSFHECLLSYCPWEVVLDSLVPGRLLKLYN